MSVEPQTIDLPPFPTMRWSDCDWWEGEIDLALGDNAGLNVTPHDPTVTRLPSDAQRDALSYQLDHGPEISAAVFSAVRKHYQKVRPAYLKYLGAEGERLMPEMTDNDDLRKLIELVHVHVHPSTTSGYGYVGLQFGCSWDREHGLGVMMYRDQVVEVGGADVSFAFSSHDTDKQQR